MFYLTVLFLILLIPLAVLAGRRVLARDSASGLRSAFTVVQAGVVLLVVLCVFEIGYTSILQYSLLSGGYDGIRISFLRYAETALVTFYWLVVLAAEFFSRRKDRLRPAVVYPVGIACLVLVCAGLLILVYNTKQYYYNFMLYAVLGVGIVGVLHWTNFLLSFRANWQRTVITAVNGAVFLLMAALTVLVLKMGAAEIGDAVSGSNRSAVLLTGLAAAIFLTPPVVNIGTVVAGHFKES